MVICKVTNITDLLIGNIVRYVIHHALPMSLDGYVFSSVQEALPHAKTLPGIIKRLVVLVVMESLLFVFSVSLIYVTYRGTVFLTF